MGLRPQVRQRMQWLRLLATGIIITLALQSTWMLVQFDGEYTQGPPAPTEIHALLTIDSEEEVGSIEISRATNFLIWSFTRDSSAKIDYYTNDSTNLPNADDLAKQASTEPSAHLENTREAVGIIVGILMVCEFVLLFDSRWARWFRNTCLMALVACFLFAVPLSYTYDVMNNTGAGFVQENDPDRDAFAHYTSSSDLHLVPLGFIVDVESEGYDLGWVEKEHRANVTAEPPEPGQPGSDSLVKFDGTLLIAAGKALQYVLLLPFLWFIIPCVDCARASTEEEE